MRKFIVSALIIVCLHQIVLAQFVERNLENASFVLKRSYSQNPYKVNRVKSIIGKKQTKKGFVKTGESILNAAAFSTMTAKFADNGKKKSVNIYQYRNDTLLTDCFIVRHGKDTVTRAQYQYDSKNRMIDSKWNMSLFFVPVRERRYDYNDRNKETSAKFLTRKGEIKYKYEYDYFDNGSKKETRYYKRDKLKNRWIFDCDPKGEEIKKVKTANYCTKRTLNSDGSFVEVFEYRYKNGKPTKTICYYTADTLLVKYEEYGKNGVLKEKRAFTYDKSGNRTELLLFGNHKLKKRYMFTHNEKNLCTKTDEFNSNGKLVNSYMSEYTYY